MEYKNIKNSNFVFCEIQNWQTKINAITTWMVDKTDVIEREFGVYKFVEDNYPKYAIWTDIFDFSQDGIIHKSIIDWLLGN